MKTDKVKIPILLILVIGLLFTSCMDDLELTNPNFQTSDNFWQTSDDAMKGLTAVYNSLIIAYSRATPVLLDVRGDDIVSKSPWDQIFGAARFSMSPENASFCNWSYSIYYQGIYRANQVLDNVPNIEGLDENLRDRIRGQAHFLRGLYFFHLVNLYGSVPLPLTSPTSTDDMIVGQSTEEEGWEQVISDFRIASTLLPISYSDVLGPDKGQVGRATKGAALAFLGKALLFTKQYSESADQFEAVFDLNIYNLVQNYRDNFTEVNENNSEAIFEIQYSRELGGMTGLGETRAPSSADRKTSIRARTYAPRGFGYTDVQPNKTVIDEFLKEKTIDDEDDPRLAATLFYNKPGTILYGRLFATVYANNSDDLNDAFSRKYQNDDSGRPNENDSRSGINERIMRYADVLLMYAECLNELGSTSQSYGYIQEVRDRVNLPDLSVVMPDMTQEQMREQIAHERLLEFVLEGHRFDDIRRWGWLQDNAKLAILKARDSEFNTYIPGRELYPIPQSEIDNNPGYIQNPGY